MTWNQVSALTFLWWNTGLSPPIAKSSHRQPDRPFAASQIKLLREKSNFQILGLAEVSTEDLNFILEHVGDSSLAVVDRTNRGGRIKFDTAIIYDRDAVVAVDGSSLIERFGKSQMKLGELVTFATKTTGDLIHVVASHWPSRRTAGQFSSRRSELGTLLRRSLDNLRTANSDPYVVLMGDYNDDPFSVSLAEHLLATRDRELARRDSRFLYNPFWRRIGESHSFPSENGHSICGTHYYSGGEFTEWVTFDQFIFSSAFLSDGPIVLAEEFSQIVFTEELKDRVLDKKQVFDHYPVSSVAVLRRQQ